MEKIKKQKAFTLVELIIVITILAVLATIAFLSFRSYTVDSRDAQRLANLSNIEKALSVFYVQKGYYPTPDGNISTGVINGNSIVIKGEFGKKASQLVGFSNIPLDPLVQNPYSYSILENKKEYQAGGMLEKTYANNGIISHTYANSETVKMIGDYKGYIKFASGCTMYANVPSILWSNSGSVNLLDTTNTPSTPRYIINKGKNILFRFTGIQNDVITGSSLPDTVLQDLRQSEQARLISLCEAELKAINSSTPEPQKQEVLASFGVPDVKSITEVILADKPIPGQTLSLLTSENGGGASTSLSPIFTTKWRVGDAGFGSNTLGFNLVSSGSYTVNWGDGNIENFLTGSSLLTHTYSGSGEKLITIEGDIKRFYDGGYHLKLLSVESWDGVVWGSFERMFQNASNLTSLPAGAPNLSNVESLYRTFSYATNFNVNINHWDVSHVTNMLGLFEYTFVFNQPLNNWNTANVTNMNLMFRQAYLFNQPLNNWNTANVLSMNGMFYEADDFNSSLAGWNVENVTNFGSMFRGADDFNGSLAGWNPKNPTNLTYMFSTAPMFDQNISSWFSIAPTGPVDMGQMFSFSNNFNQDISGWKTSTTTNMNNMFNMTTKFNRNLSSWNVSGVTVGVNCAGFNYGTVSTWTLPKPALIASCISN